MYAVEGRGKAAPGSPPPTGALLAVRQAAAGGSWRAVGPLPFPAGRRPRTSCRWAAKRTERRIRLKI